MASPGILAPLEWIRPVFCEESLDSGVVHLAAGDGKSRLG